MNDYRIQRLKEDLTMAQQRNKKQRIQLANYKKCHERDLATINKLQSTLEEIREYINTNCDFNGTALYDKWVAGKAILQIIDKGIQ